VIGMMKKFWRRLFRHRHSWKVTHTNKWQIPTRKICRKCCCVANVERFEQEPRLTYRWLYDYGKGFGRVGGRKDMGGH